MEEAEEAKVVGRTPRKVPCVRDVAKEALSGVPERYIRREIESPIVSDTASLPEVPVIDVAKLLSEDGKGPELDKLHLASKQWGLFQVINHGVNLELVENVKKGAEELFNLSMEEKNKLWQKPGDMEGFGQMFEVSEHQKLDWVDAFYIITLPSHMRKPDLFPNLPQPFRDNLDVYCEEVRELAMKILEQMGKTLKMEPNEMKESFREGGQAMRMNYYPPCPQAEDVIGIDAHTDGAALTVLLQVTETVGLQTKKDGLWIPVKPLPNSFVVNVGDVLEIMTNGMYRSAEHRATINSEKERLSVATFYGPGGDALIGPSPSLVTQERPASFRTVTVADYYKGLLTMPRDGPTKSYVEVMRIQNGDHNDSSLQLQ